MAEIPFSQGEKIPPRHYRTVVALGKGWDHESQSKTPILSLGSILTAEAAAVLYEQDITSSILLTGGKTAGERFQSEAEAMLDYIRAAHPKIPDDVLFLETEALDTAGNAENSLRILKEHNIHDGIVLLSDESHQSRTREVFSHYGVPFAATETFENVLEQYSDNFRGAVEPYRRTTHSLQRRIKEGALQHITHRNPSGSWLRKITSVTRK